MSYLLWHASTSGQIGMPAKSAHIHRGPRVYKHDGHFVEVDGQGFDAYEDVEAILKIPGYRLATPEESNAYYAEKNNAKAIHETSSPAEKVVVQQEEKHPPKRGAK